MTHPLFLHSLFGLFSDLPPFSSQVIQTNGPKAVSQTSGLPYQIQKAVYSGPPLADEDKRVVRALSAPATDASVPLVVRAAAKAEEEEKAVVGRGRRGRRD